MKSREKVLPFNWQRTSTPIRIPNMATVVSLSSISPNLNLNSKNFTSQPTYSRKLSRVRCNVENSSTKGESEPRNALLKIAWYGSELLGIAASFLRSPSPSDVENDLKLDTDGSGAVALDRATVVQAIKEDFGRSYFVTGNLTLDAYEEDCEFADPAGSFKGLRRFKRNCTNFGLLIDKSNMNLTRWDDFENGPDDSVCDQLNMIEQAERIFFYIDAGLMELLALNCIWAQDKGIGHWRFNCIMSFPWRPILSATGYTEYYFNAETGKVCRHVEHWNVPKMALFKQILRPSRGGGRKSGG